MKKSHKTEGGNKMLGKKRWLVVVTDAMHDWIKQTAKEAGVKGTHLVRELIEREMANNSEKFKASLANARIRNQIQELATKKAALAEQEAELHRKLKKQEASVG